LEWKYVSWSAKETPLLHVMSGRPKKPLSGYFQFQQDHKAEVAHLTTLGERSGEISKLWAAVPEEEKK